MNLRLATSEVFRMFTQLSSFNPIIVQMSEKRVHQIVKMNGCCFSNFYDKT